MRLILFILFAALPFIELALLIYLGQQIGFWPTLLIVIGTGFAGAVVLQTQGLMTMRRMSQSISAGEAPIRPVVDGFFLVIAGAFLLTPGVITDCIGLLLLIPQVRQLVASWGIGRALRSGQFKFYTFQTEGRSDGGRASHPFARHPNAPEAEAAPASDRSRFWKRAQRGSASSAAKSADRASAKSGNQRRDGPVIDGEFEEIKRD